MISHRNSLWSATCTVGDVSWSGPAELRDSCLLSLVTIASWSALFLPAHLLYNFQLSRMIRHSWGPWLLPVDFVIRACSALWLLPSEGHHQCMIDKWSEHDQSHDQRHSDMWSLHAQPLDEFMISKVISASSAPWSVNDSHLISAW